LNSISTGSDALKLTDSERLIVDILLEILRRVSEVQNPKTLMGKVMQKKKS